LVDQEEIHNQCLSNDPKERIDALEELENSFSFMPDKKQAWDDLHRLTNDEDSDVRSSAAEAFGSAFSQLPDKQQAWNDLLRLANDKYRSVRSSAASALGSSFSQLPDKQQAWDDLHRLTNDESRNMRLVVAYVLGSSFSQLPDKQQAWNDLHKLTNDEDSDVRYSAASALGSSFSQLPDKQQAWDDLHKLTNDESWNVRFVVAYVLGSSFSQLPDKQQAWNDLMRLTNDESWIVRYSAASDLGSVFSEVPDKQQAWNDLHRLTNDEIKYVRSSAAFALGFSFSQLPDKQQAWNDLMRLTNDEDILVRTSSNHSLGRVSIFMASQAEKEENYKKELEKAIEFFETAAKEPSDSNSAEFCLPFYRSFYTIIFKKQEAKDEVDRYLVEAKSAIKDSESKKQLFEAVQNLAEALKEVQNLGNLDLSVMKDELNFYRKYCDHAAELMAVTEEIAPFATKVLRKGLPLLDRNLKELLEEIQKKAKTACQVSQGTNTEEIACTVNKEVQKWEINSQEEMSWYVNILVAVLKSKIPHNKENKEILDTIECMKFEKDLTKQYRILSTVIGLIPTVNVVAVDPIVENITKVGQDLGTKQDGLSKEMDKIRISLSSGIKEEIEISVGTEILGNGITHKITIPLQEISYVELKDDLIGIKGKHITKLSKLPEKLARKIKGYLLLKDREDIIEQLT